MVQPAASLQPVMSFMTKNLGNAKPSAPAKEINPSLFSRAAPALFPLVVAALGYLVGRHFLGF